VQEDTLAFFCVDWDAPNRRMVTYRRMYPCNPAPATRRRCGPRNVDEQNHRSSSSYSLSRSNAADVAQHGHDAFLTHFAEDGVEIVQGGGFDTKDDMRKQPAWPQGTTLTWTPVKAEMSKSGDLGFTYGNYVFTAKNKDGKLVAGYGKYTSIWKKQEDGQWKVLVDMGNDSPDPKTGK